MYKQTYDILAIGAHPDDVEVGAGGVLIDAADRGYRCGLAVMTRGEMATGGTPEIRADEIHEAAKIMGVDVIETWNWGDTRLTASIDKRIALAEVIRLTQPRIILAPYPHIGHGRRQSHPDHVAAGVIAVNAAHLASLAKADLTGQAHLTERLFHYFLPPSVVPDFVVNITPHYERWIKALSAHRSQFLNPEKSKDYLEHLSAMARAFGLQARCKYGQGFSVSEPIAVNDIMSLTVEEN